MELCRWNAEDVADQICSYFTAIYYSCIPTGSNSSIVICNILSQYADVALEKNNGMKVEANVLCYVQMPDHIIYLNAHA